MTIDLTGLKVVPFSKGAKSPGFFYYNPVTDELVARTCNKCLVVLPRDHFYKDNRLKHKTRNVCKECANSAYTSWLDKNHDQKKAYNRAYCVENPQVWKNHTKRLSERTDSEIMYDQAQRHPQGMKNCRKCAQDLPLASFSRCVLKRDGLQPRCKECSALKKYDARVRPYIEYWQKNDIPLECYVCQGPYEQSDHVIPEALDGLDDPENRLPMCEHHNTSKQDTPLLKWLTERHPDKSEAVMQRVFDYGVSPWTSKDVVWHHSEDAMSRHWPLVIMRGKPLNN